MPFYRGMTGENVTISGDKGTPITAYVATPSGPGRFPGVVLVHHLPGRA
jgi:carboxymethylenebutenolidase